MCNLAKQKGHKDFYFAAFVFDFSDEIHSFSGTQVIIAPYWNNYASLLQYNVGKHEDKIDLKVRAVLRVKFEENEEKKPSFILHY